MNNENITIVLGGLDFKANNVQEKTDVNHWFVVDSRGISIGRIHARKSGRVYGFKWYGGVKITPQIATLTKYLELLIHTHELVDTANQDARIQIISNAKIHNLENELREEKNKSIWKRLINA